MLPTKRPLFIHLTKPVFPALLRILLRIVVLSRQSLAGLGLLRRPIAILVRCPVIAVIVFAPAGPEWVRRADDQTVVFALDQSAGILSALTMRWP